MRIIFWSLFFVATVSAEKHIIPACQNISRTFCSTDFVDIAQLRDSIKISGVRQQYTESDSWVSLKWMLAEDSLIIVQASYASETVEINKLCPFSVVVQVPDTLVHFNQFYDKFKLALQTVSRYTNWEWNLDRERPWILFMVI